MNTPHQNARLTLHSREQIVARVAAGRTGAEVAAALAVSVRTVRKCAPGSARAGARRLVVERPERLAPVAAERRLLEFHAASVAARPHRIAALPQKRET